MWGGLLNLCSDYRRYDPTASGGRPLPDNFENKGADVHICHSQSKKLDNIRFFDFLVHLSNGYIAESIKTLVVMYRMLKYLIFIVLPLVAIGCADSATNTDEEQNSDFIPGQVIVRFASSVSLDSGQVIIESFALISLEVLSDEIKIVLIGVPVGQEIQWVKVLNEHPAIHSAQLNHTGIKLREDLSDE